jgi:amino acid transporter
VTVNHYAPALVFLCILSLMFLSTRNVYRLIDYAAFVEFMFILVANAGFPYLRYTRPDLPRPIKITLGISIIFLLICTFLMASGGKQLAIKPTEFNIIVQVGIVDRCSCTCSVSGGRTSSPCCPCASTSGATPR